MDKKHLYAIILAGGSGTRFWPVSRKTKPKQFLKIVQNKTLLDLTVNRIRPAVNLKNIYIVTNEKYKKETAAQLKKFKIPSRNILLEPSAKNTAPALCWAAARIHYLDPEAVTLCLPSDHLIINQIKFISCIKQAVSLAQKGLLVTFGIVPTRAETGYGYLQTALGKVDGKKFLSVKKFTEKPSRSKAERFVRSKNYFWNSGMFVWRTETILDEFKSHLPGIHTILGKNPTYPYILKRWKRLPKISIDYGILEKSDKVAAVRAKDLGWSDLGSWESLFETLGKDKNGNVFLSCVHDIDTKSSFVYAKEKEVALIGMRECVVVDTKDALLVCKMDESQKVKDLVEGLIGGKSKLT